MSKTKNYTRRIAIYEYNQAAYSEPEIENLERKIFSEVPIWDRVSGTVYYDEKGNHFIFTSIMYNSKHAEVVYFVKQVYEKKESSIITLGKPN